jgi:hypothetical protein
MEEKDRIDDVREEQEEDHEHGGRGPGVRESTQ